MQRLYVRRRIDHLFFDNNKNHQNSRLLDCQTKVLEFLKLFLWQNCLFFFNLNCYWLSPTDLPKKNSKKCAITIKPVFNPLFRIYCSAVSRVATHSSSLSIKLYTITINSYTVFNLSIVRQKCAHTSISMEVAVTLTIDLW